MKLKPTIKELLRREYMRGLIDGQNVVLKKGYTFDYLNRLYRKYLKVNPETKKEIDSYQKSVDNSQNKQ